MWQVSILAVVSVKNQEYSRPAGIMYERSPSRRQGALTLRCAASTEINAPNLNSQKHSLMVPRGICVEPLPFSLFIYLF